MNDKLKELYEKRISINEQLEQYGDNNAWELWDELDYVQGEIDVLEEENE